MTFGFFAFNFGPAKLMTRLADAARKEGVEPILCPPQRPGSVHEYVQELKEKCSAVLLGVSFDVDEETALARGIQGDHAPTLFTVEDFPGNAVANVAQLRAAAPLMRGVFAASPPDEKRYLDGGYRPDGIFYVGPPAHWQDDMLPFREGREMRVRGGVSKVRRGMEASVLATDQVIYIAGSKSISKEIELIAYVTEACQGSLDRTVLHYRPHPGERTKWKSEGRESEYEGLLRELESQRAETWSIANEEFNSPNDPQLRAAADSKSHGISDVTIGHPGATAWNWLGYQGHPGIVCMPLVRQTGFEYEQSPALRVAEVARSMDEVRDLLVKLLSDAGRLELQDRQRRALFLERGEAIDWNTGRKLIRKVKEVLVHDRAGT